MSRRLGISWGLNQEKQQVGQEPKTSSTADEEICNNKEQNKGSVCKLSTINWLITQTGCNWCIYLEEKNMKCYFAELDAKI